MKTSCIIDVEHTQVTKQGQVACGDVFLSRRNPVNKHITAVLSDGLGSGIKANMLGTLTATMALTFLERNLDLKRAANIIMDTLPVCRERGLAYATFTLVDISPDGHCQVVEFDSPPFLLLRHGVSHTPAKHTLRLPGPTAGAQRILRLSNFQLCEHDMLVFFSDGITQAGIGRVHTPLGWTQDAVSNFAAGLIKDQPERPAAEVAKLLAEEAVALDGYRPGDDITCAVMHFRPPRQLMLATGPPFDPRNDPQLARQLGAFPGRKIVCGGTTAHIIARELHRDIQPDFEQFDPVVPPPSIIKGIDLVTEGNLTLAVAAQLLEASCASDQLPKNGAGQLVAMLLESDILHFLIGTRINDTHQNPEVSVEMDLRRNVIRRIAACLEKTYLKETHLSFL